MTSEEVVCVLLVPYRTAKYQNREHHLSEFLRRMPSTLDASIGNDKWAIAIVEQSADTQKFSRGRCLNVAARMSVLRYPKAHFVLHDVDLIPDEARAALYAIKPAEHTIIALNTDSKKYKGCSEYVGGICSVSQETFLEANGFQNSFQGWGGEDDCFRDAVKELAHESDTEWFTCRTDGHVEDLEETDNGFRRACEVPQYKCEKEVRRSLREIAKANHFNDGYRELKFQMTSLREYSKHMHMYTANLYVTLNPGWIMSVSRSTLTPYYYNVITGKSQYELPGVALLQHEPVYAVLPKRARVDNKSVLSSSLFVDEA